jgi:glucan phosphoethanolaminetransferase (alkaline phosphatase superfamily)
MALRSGRGSSARAQLILALELALLLAAPAFLLAVALPRCGAPGLAVPAAVTVLGQFALLALTRTWGAFFLANLPLVALGPVYAWYVTAFAAPFDENALAVIANSSVEEAIGFVRQENLGPALVLFALFVSVYIALVRRFRGVPLVIARRVYFVSAIPLALTSALAYGHETSAAADACVSTSFPVGAIIGIVNAGIRKIGQTMDDREKFPMDARRATGAATPETHILVIGESARFDAFALNGYAGSRTSQLATMRGLVSYRNAYAPSNVTTTSVTITLTGVRPEAYAQAGAHIGLVKAARESGYHVTWLSNNVVSFTHYLGAGRDSCLPANARKVAEFVWEPSSPDAVLLPCLDRELASTQPLKLIVLHTYGSHWEYANRLPDDGFHVAGVSRAEALRRRRDAAEPERVSRDIYDDTIAYTEQFLSEVIERARRLPGHATVTYFSDHGESFRFQDGVAGHAHPNFSLAEAHIPLIFWANDAFIADHPRAWGNLEARRDQLFRTDGIYHTVASLMGIVSSELDPGRDLTSERYLAPAALPELTFLAWTKLKSMRMAVNWPRQ